MRSVKNVQPGVVVDSSDDGRGTESTPTVGSGTRLRDVRKAKRLSQQALADLSGIAKKTIVRYEAGEPISARMMEKLATALEVDPAFLAYGTGVAPTFIDEMPPTPHESSDLPLTVDPDQVVWIDLSEAEPTAGHGGAPDDRRAGRYPLFASVARDLGHPRVKLAAVRVRGDSMEPSLRDGDYVVVARDPTAMEDICVIDIGGELMVKRVHRDMATGGLIVVSDNKAYPPQPIGPDANVRIIGRVVKEDRVRRR